MSLGHKPSLTLNISALSLMLCSAATFADQASAVDPYAVNDGQIPSKAEYDGPLWRFNYHYPKTLLESEKPWTKVLNGKPLTKENAHAYIEALKQAVSKDMRIMVTQPKEWNSKPHNWFSMLWAGEAVKPAEKGGKRSTALIPGRFRLHRFTPNPD